MYTVLGIDADTLRIAYCRLNVQDGAFTLHSIGSVTRREMKRTPGVSRYTATYTKELRDVLYPVMEADGDIYLEDAYMGRNRRTYGYLSQVQGELRYEVGAVFGAKKPMNIIQPSVWQSSIGKYFGLPFRAPLDTKECAMRCAAKILKYVPASTHEADATCIAFYGYMEHIRVKDVSNAPEKKKGAVSRKR